VTAHRFSDGVFEAMASTDAFHWLPDQDAALSEFFRVLAPGGGILVSLVNPSLETLSRIERRLSSLMGEPANWPARERMRLPVERAGFRVEPQRFVLRVPGTQPFLFSRSRAGSDACGVE